MATHGWRTGQSLIGGIRENVYGFDLFQAIRLLKHWVRENDPVAGEHLLRFGSTRQSSFPGASIEGLESGHRAILMRMAFMGLSGPNAPLPDPYHQWLQDNLGRGDKAMAEFLDIFNHRLIELFYQIRQKYTPGLSSGSPLQMPIAGYLSALTGMATRGIDPLLPLPKRSLLAVAGLLSDQRMSLPRVQNILGLYLRNPVKVKTLQGSWEILHQRQWSHLGSSGQNQILGQETMLGKRVWIQQSTLQIRIGPLSLKTFSSLLPSTRSRRGEGLQRLRQVLDFLTQKSFHYQIVLILRQEDQSLSRLNTWVNSRLGWGFELGRDVIRKQEPRTDGMELGWSSWLKTRPDSTIPQTPPRIQIEMRQETTGETS